MTPTREEIVKLLRIGGEAAGRLRATSANASGRQTWAAAERNLATAADALDAAPVLTFEEKVRQATNAARKASPAFTQRFASATADRIIRAALRAAGVQE